MYYNIAEILKASVCSFCENIYEDNSIDECNFERYLLEFINDADLEEDLKRSTADTCYDVINIENTCRDRLFFLKNKNFSDIEEIKEHCNNAYLMTLTTDKTINIEAFVENLADEFSKIRI